MPSSPAVSQRMRNTLRRDTPLEVAIRRILFAAGLRYRVDCVAVAGMRRRADLLFRSARIAVFVDGCFWHCCPQHATWPKANRAWWRRKLLGNAARDRDTDRRLRAAGWQVIRVWEHTNAEVAAARIMRGLQRRGSRRGPLNPPA
ncbi:MAG: DNA mismatch endonuclease Vsr [Planctomycetes bacterium]|nr:DNA mismatch endonuclease Vsr [Planctomycetota bacterium]